MTSLEINEEFYNNSNNFAGLINVNELLKISGISSIKLPDFFANDEDKELKDKGVLEPLKWNDPNLIHQIRKRYNKNNKEVLIDEILPLINNRRFFNFILKEQIPFSSKKDGILADRFCATLLELGKRKGLRKAGNPQGGQNYINKSNAFAKEIGPLLDRIDEEGYTSYQKKAMYLNKKDISAILGGKWSPSSVRGVWMRWKKIAHLKS